MYAPQLGRFVSRDPIGYARRNSNLFGFCDNSPAVYMDPSGLCPSDEAKAKPPLIEDCEIRVFAGHCVPPPNPAFPELRNRELIDLQNADWVYGKIWDINHDFPQLPPCSAVGGIGCYPAELRHYIEPRFPGQTVCPSFPDGFMPDTECVVRLEKMLEEARKKAAELCKVREGDKPRCKAIRIKVQCDSDFRKCVREKGRGEQRDLCTNHDRVDGAYQNLVKCNDVDQ